MARDHSLCVGCGACQPRWAPTINDLWIGDFVWEPEPVPKLRVRYKIHSDGSKSLIAIDTVSTR